MPKVSHLASCAALAASLILVFAITIHFA